MITKKFFFILLLFLISVYSVVGQSNYTISLDFSTGFLLGTAYELIYDKSGNAEYVSELQWNMKPLWYGGISFEFGLREPSTQVGFYGVMGLKVGLPIKTGVMEDRDWLTPTTTPGSLTFFSSHENTTKAAVILDVEPGISLPLVNHFSMYLYLGFSYMYFKFEAKNGYTQYGNNNKIATQGNPYEPWNPSWPKVAISGVGVDYAQHWFIVGPGIGFMWSWKKLAANASISVSPLVVSYTVDNHYKRNPPFQATAFLSKSFFVEPKTRFVYQFNNRYGLGLSLSYRFLAESIGDLEQVEKTADGKVKTTLNNVAGSSYSAFSGEVFFKLSF